MADHYETLGIPRFSPIADVKRAFKQLAMRYHPDRNPDSPEAEERFKLLGQAYEVLSDPAAKELYDQKLRNILLYWAQAMREAEQEQQPPRHRDPRYRPSKPPGYRPEPARKEPRKLKYLYAYVFGGMGVYLYLALLFAQFMDRQAALAFLDEAKVYYFEQHSAPAAAERLARAFEKNEELAEAHYLYAKILYEHYKNYQKALHHIGLALTYREEETPEETYRLLRGHCARMVADYQLAETDYAFILVKNAAQIEVIDGWLDMCLYQRRDYPCAQEQLQRLEALGGLNPAQALDQAVLWQQTGQADPAKKLLDQLVTEPSLAGAAHYYMGVHFLNVEHDTLLACQWWGQARAKGTRDFHNEWRFFCERE